MIPSPANSASEMILGLRTKLRRQEREVMMLFGSSTMATCRMDKRRILAKEMFHTPSNGSIFSATGALHEPSR